MAVHRLGGWGRRQGLSLASGVAAADRPRLRLGGLMRRNLLGTRNGRFLTFGLLCVSEGIPYGFTSVAMVAFMRQHGVSLEVIGAFSAALFLPWAFKWAWAPLIDLVRLDRWGGRRAWIIACTTMMLLSPLLLASIDAGQHFRWLLVTVIVHNFFCATQDVAIDSLAVSTLRADERARGNGFMFGGQYLGIMLGGGAAVFVTGLAGFRGALVYVGTLCVMNLAFVLLFVFDPGTRPLATRPPHFIRTLVAHRVAFVKVVYASFWRSGRGPVFGTAFRPAGHRPDSIPAREGRADGTRGARPGEGSAGASGGGRRFPGIVDVDDAGAGFLRRISAVQRIVRVPGGLTPRSCRAPAGSRRSPRPRVRPLRTWAAAR